ncbi:MAG: hypothetical protein AVDCRST_MAG31-563, partial [uncultured Sphingomonas sp.]
GTTGQAPKQGRQGRRTGAGRPGSRPQDGLRRHAARSCSRRLPRPARQTRL